MNEKEFRQEIEKHVDEINAKINTLKFQVVEPSLRGDFQKLIEELEEIRQRIEKTYRGAGEEEGKDWDTLRKNIYTDIKSFDNAFTRAGKMFNPEP